MTLTSIIPSLRASLPDPLDPTLWPAVTVATVDDVTVRVVSMQRLAAVVGTPCVHTAEEAPPRYRPRDWRPRGALLVVAEAVYTITDPPLKALRRLIPPLTLGAVRLDLAFLVLMLVTSVLMGIL